MFAGLGGSMQGVAMATLGEHNIGTGIVPSSEAGIVISTREDGGKISLASC